MEVQVVGISVDSPFSNQAFAEKIGVKFPLLSDFHRKVSREYGILNEETGTARRTTFVLDKDGIIRFIEQGQQAIDIKGAKNACQMLKKPT
ncbi:MAG: redoxin domain-containing protein [Acidobacteria bacterium]|nr:redoxin domain-containing protein [Acidobacteriota bacterium]